MGLHNIKFLFDNYQRNSSSLFGFTVKDLNCFFCFKATYFAEANKKNQKEEQAEETEKVSSEQK